jgi:opacity protein-like surface antigen
MRKIWLLASAAIALFAASCAAFAADLSLTKAPPPALYNWTGFYLGANIGGAWVNGALTDTLTGASFTGNVNPAIGGATVGYNLQLANIVFGIEGTFDGTSLGNNNDTVTTPIDSFQGRVVTNWVSTLAARVGVAQNNWLIYAKGGGGWADNTVTVTSLTTGVSVSSSNTPGGWLVGGGIEYGLSANWSIKVEYDYLHLSDWNGGSPFLPGDTINLSRQINMITFGANYRF